MNDVLQRVAADGQKAVDTFLPSIKNPPQPPPRPPNPMAQQNASQVGLKALLTYRKVRDMAHREVYGIPPDKPSTPEELFGNVLDVAHTRALSRAIANHPEEEQGRLIAEAHDSATRWIAANNGKVIVHGQVKTADFPKAAEALAAQIVNDTVTEHDEREAGGPDAGDGKDGDKPHEASHAPERPQPAPHDSRGERTPAPPPTPPERPSAPDPGISAQPSVPPSLGRDNGSAAGTGAVLDGPIPAVQGPAVAGDDQRPSPQIDPPTGEIPPESTPQVGAEETPQEEAVAVDSGDALRVSMESDGPQGPDLPSPSPGNDEQLSSGIPERRPQGGDKSKQLKKGDAVTLRDGSSAEVQWHHPGAKLLRVKIAGSTKSTMIDPDKDLA